MSRNILIIGKDCDFIGGLLRREDHCSMQDGSSSCNCHIKLYFNGLGILKRFMKKC